MAVKVGELYGELKLDKKPFDSGLDQAETKSKGWASRISSTLGGAAGALLKWGAVGATVAAGGAFMLGNKASDLNETISKTNVVFGESAGSVLKWGADAATGLGMSTESALSANATLGNLFVSMGLGTPAAADMSMNMVELAGDLASFNNQDPTEVLEKLRAGLVGEAEPLRALGVNINAAATEAKAMELGLGAVGRELTAGEKAQANYAIILDQTKTAQGDFARTSGGMANQQRIVAATFTDTMGQIGQAFVPLFEAILPQVTAGLQSFGAWVTGNMPAIQAVMGAVVGGIGTAFSILFTQVIPALVGAFQTAWPIILGVIQAAVPIISGAFNVLTTQVIPAVQAGFNVLINDVMPRLSEAFTWIVTNVLPGLKEAFSFLTTNVIPALATTISNIADAVLPAVGAAFDVLTNTIIPAIIDTINFLQDNWETFGPIFKGVAITIAGVLAGVLTAAFVGWAVAAGAAALATMAALAPVIIPIAAIGIAVGLLILVWENFRDDIGRIIGQVADKITDVFGTISDFMSDVWDDIAGVIKGGVNTVIGMINRMIGFLNNINVPIPRIDIPGTDIGIGGGSFNPFNIGRLSYLASGVRGFAGGLAMVGERGPELAYLPRGTNVYSNQETSQMLSGTVEVVMRDPDGAVARGGYSQADLQRAVSTAVRSVIGGARSAGARV